LLSASAKNCVLLVGVPNDSRHGEASKKANRRITSPLESRSNGGREELV